MEKYDLYKMFKANLLIILLPLMSIGCSSSQPTQPAPLAGPQPIVAQANIWEEVRQHYVSTGAGNGGAQIEICNLKGDVLIGSGSCDERALYSWNDLTDQGTVMTFDRPRVPLTVELHLEGNTFSAILILRHTDGLESFKADAAQQYWEGSIKALPLEQKMILSEMPSYIAGERPVGYAEFTTPPFLTKSGQNEEEAQYRVKIWFEAGEANPR